MAILESKSTYRNRCFLKSRIFKLNQCFYGCLVIQVITHFLITLNKHPNIRCKESAVTTLFCHLRSMNDKRRKEIALIICIVIFNKLIQLQIHIRRTHIRRICHNHIIFLCQCFRHLYQRKHFSQCRLTGHIYIFCNLSKAIIQGRPILWCYGQNRTIFLGIMQLFDDGIHSRC